MNRIEIVEFQGHRLHSLELMIIHWDVNLFVDCCCQRLQTALKTTYSSIAMIDLDFIIHQT